MPINVIVCNCNGRLNKLIDVDLLVKKLSREKTVGNVCVVDNLCKGEIKETLPSKEPVLVLACSPCKNTRLPLVLRHFLRGVSFEVVDVLSLVNSGEPREVTTLKALSIALAHIQHLASRRGGELLVLAKQRFTEEVAFGASMVFDKVTLATENEWVFIPKQLRQKPRNLEVLTSSRLLSIKKAGEPFRVATSSPSNLIDPEKCTLCLKCVVSCPVSIGGVKPIKAPPSPSVLPKTPFIDTKTCIYFVKGGCGVCIDACETKAINLKRKPLKKEVSPDLFLVDQELLGRLPAGLIGENPLKRVFNLGLIDLAVVTRLQPSLYMVYLVGWDGQPIDVICCESFKVERKSAYELLRCLSKKTLVMEVKARRVLTLDKPLRKDSLLPSSAWFLRLSSALFVAPRRSEIDDVNPSMFYSLTLSSSSSYPPVKARVNPYRCTGCLVCLRCCPYSAITVKDSGKAEIKAEACTGCGFCVESCPVGAVNMESGGVREALELVRLYSQFGIKPVLIVTCTQYGARVLNTLYSLFPFKNVVPMLVPSFSAAPTSRILSMLTRGELALAVFLSCNHEILCPWTRVCELSLKPVKHLSSYPSYHQLVVLENLFSSVEKLTNLLKNLVVGGIAS